MRARREQPSRARVEGQRTHAWAVMRQLPQRLPGFARPRSRSSCRHCWRQLDCPGRIPPLWSSPPGGWRPSAEVRPSSRKILFATTCGQETSIGAQSRRSKRPLLGSKNNRGPLRKELHGPRPSLECLCGPEGAERLGGQLGGDSSAGARQCRRSDREQMWPRWPAGGRWQGYALRPRAAVPARQTSARLRRQRSGQRDRIQAVAAYGLIWPPDRRACAARRHAPSPARAPVPVAPRRRAALVAAIRSWPR